MFFFNHGEAGPRDSLSLLTLRKDRRPQRVFFFFYKPGRGQTKDLYTVLIAPGKPNSSFDITAIFVK